MRSLVASSMRRMSPVIATRREGLTSNVTDIAWKAQLRLTEGEEGSDAGQDCFEERYREREPHNLAERTSKLGIQIVPAVQLGSKQHCRSAVWRVILKRQPLPGAGEFHAVLPDSASCACGRLVSHGQQRLRI